MPLTEKLENALNDHNVTMVQVADLLKKDGINCRESVSFDTPLIIAARANNTPVVEYILSSIKNPNDKIGILNATNKKEETALNMALRIPNDKKTALLLLKHGADIAKSILNLPSAAMEWMRVFINYQQLKVVKNPDAEKLQIRAACEAEIGHRYAYEMGDTEEANKWFELAANDGDRQAMLNLALAYQNEKGDLTQALYWYKRSYPLWTDQKNRDVIIGQLQIIASALDNQENAYDANMTLGGICASQNDITAAVIYFKHAEELYEYLPEKNENDAVFFKACSLWHGPSYEKETTALDYVDITKRFELLVQSHLDSAYSFIASIASSRDSRILQIVAYEIGKQHGLLDNNQISPLTNPENKLYVQALSTLYGWAGQPKNMLRAAGLFRKCVEENKELETKYWCNVLMAFAYLQQERERDVYISEGFFALDTAHACLGTELSPHRHEIVVTVIDAGSYVNENNMPHYLQTIMNCYARDAMVLEFETITMIEHHLLAHIDMLKDLTVITNILTDTYQKQKNQKIHDRIYTFLKEMHKAGDAEQQNVLDKALAICAQSSVDTKKYSSQHLDDLVQSYEKLADNVEDKATGDFQEKYTDALMLRAETHLNQRNYEAALVDYTQVHKETESTEALIKMAHIETELGYYDEAIDHYRIISENKSSEITNSILLMALRNLQKIHEELVLRDTRRDKIADISTSILTTIVTADTSSIKSFESLSELESFSDIVKNSPEIIGKIEEIRARIAPQEQERIDKETKQADRINNLKRKLEIKGRSADLHLTMLLSLMESEKDDEEAFQLVQTAITNWLNNVVKIEDGEVSIRNEQAVIRLAKEGNLLAEFYLAKYHEQNNNIQGALSLYARIAMSPQKSEASEKIKKDARHFIKGFASQEGGGITKIFSKQQQFKQYSVDLLEVINKPSVNDDPDTAIQSVLHEKTSTLDGASSYNNYVLGISQIFGVNDEPIQRK